MTFLAYGVLSSGARFQGSGNPSSPRETTFTVFRNGGRALDRMISPSWYLERMTIKLFGWVDECGSAGTAGKAMIKP